MDNFLFLPRAFAAALADTGFVGAFGLVIVSLLLDPAPERDLRSYLRRSTLFCTFVMLLALPVQAYLLTATMMGSSGFGVVCGQFGSTMTETHAGRDLICNCFFVLALLLLVAVGRGAQTRSRTCSLLAVLLLLAAIRAATGHSAGDGDFTLPEFVQFLHLASIAVWAGGVVASGFVVLPTMLREQRIEGIAGFMRKLSRTVTLALLLVALSGLYNAYRGLGGSMSPLVRTEWGNLLDLKVVLVFTAVAMGASSRRMLRRNRSLSPLQISHLATTLRAEAIVMLLILIVSAWLANSPPASVI